MEKENIQSLKGIQINLESLKEDYKNKLEEFMSKNKDLIQYIEKVSNEENEMKEKVKIEAIEEFEKTGQKKLIGGIGIRVLSKLNYSESEAITWADTNMPIAIKRVLDKKQFETFAKSTELDFVEKEEKVSVTFPKEIIF